MNIQYKSIKIIDSKAIYALYSDANWSAYTKDMQGLERAIQNSTFVTTAWHDNRLVGLIRGLSDHVSILMIQDVLVHGAYKRHKIGSTLIKMTLDQHQTRQTILQTDLLDPVSNAFYQKLGFFKSSDVEAQSYVLFR